MKLPTARALVFVITTLVPSIAFAGQPAVDSPEPATMMLVALGAVPFVAYLIRRKQGQAD